MSSDSKGSDLIGLTIEGRYRLDAKLGSGGMGDVYRATRILIGDLVAIKILHSHNADPNAAERFRREAQAAARIKHPNAVNIYDFGVTSDGLQYLVMELVPGVSLRSLIQEQGPLLPSLAKEITKQTCQALSEAHRQNIIHRDIKPDNIIVDTAAPHPHIKVLDFGIAKMRDDVSSNLTQTGSVLGTPHYMSPEQCLGEELDHRSDIYSLGIVLYEMLTGTVPFRSPTPAAVVVQHVYQQPVPPRSLNASILPALQSTVLRALEKQRERRQQSVDEFATDLSSSGSDFGPTFTSENAYNQHSSIPTVVLGRQSLQNTAARMSNSEVESSTSRNGARTGAIVSLTVMATIVLLTIGGLGVWLLKGDSSVSVGAPDASKAKNEETPKKQSEQSSEPSRTLQARTAPISSPSPEQVESSFTKRLRGVIGKYGVEMSLHRNGNELSGTYVYTKYRINITVTGSIDELQNVEMYGYDTRGLQIDIFKGRFSSSSRIEGVWSKPNGTKTLPFTLVQQN